MSTTCDKTRLKLNDFFIQVQVKAMRQAEISTSSRDDALDILQDSMIKLAAKYADQLKIGRSFFNVFCKTRCAIGTGEKKCATG
jgi:hypothetical protein